MFSIRWQDVADIIIMSILVYQLYAWFKNTKAFQVVTGLGVLGVIYLITKNLGFFMTSWILQELGTVLFVLIIVIFQAEIRQALYRFSLLRHFIGRPDNGLQLDLLDMSRSIFRLALERTGALIVFQRKEPLEEYLLHGIPLDSLVSGQLIGSIFMDGTPLHDGAVVIRDGRIVQASAHLPLSGNADLPQHYGTRHRAGLGLTERSDAAVVIVSEERGEVSLALAGELETIETPEYFVERLQALLAPQTQEINTARVKGRLLHNIWPKVVTVLLVLLCWFIITGKQGQIVTVTVPVKFHNLPDNLVLIKNSPEEIELQLKSLSSLVSSPKEGDLAVDLDLATAKEGKNSLAVTRDAVKLPLGVIISAMNPATVRVMIEKKVRKSVLVEARVVRHLPERLKLKRLRAEPATVTVEGPEHALVSLTSIPAEEVDLSAITQSTDITRRLLPVPPVRVLGDGTVKVHISTAGGKN